MRHPVVGAEDLGRLADVDRVGAVELHAAYGLGLVEDEHVLGVLVALDQAAGGDHLADVETCTLLGAQTPEGGVRDTGHRREHHRGVDGQAAELQRAGKRHAFYCPASGAAYEIYELGEADGDREGLGATYGVGSLSQVIGSNSS